MGTATPISSSAPKPPKTVWGQPCSTSATSCPRLQPYSPAVAAPENSATKTTATRAAAPAAERFADAQGYGGRRILERLAHLCDWHGLRFTRDATAFRVTWRIPASQRGEPDGAD